MARKTKRDRRRAGAPLARLRWKHVSKSERSAIISELNRQRWADIPKSKRRALMPKSPGRPRLFPRCPCYNSHRYSPKTGRCPCGFVRSKQAVTYGKARTETLTSLEIARQE